MKQTQVKRHVKLAKFGCLRCGRFLFAPSWYKLYYNVMVCNCDASHYKTSAVEVPDHIQEYWDAQFNAVGHVAYRRRLRRWAKRHPPNEHLYNDAFDKWSALNDANRNENDLRFKAILQFLRSHKPKDATMPGLWHTLNARKEKTMSLFESFIHFVKTHRKARGSLSRDNVKLSVEASSKGR